MDTLELPAPEPATVTRPSGRVARFLRAAAFEILVRAAWLLDQAVGGVYLFATERTVYCRLRGRTVFAVDARPVRLIFCLVAAVFALAGLGVLADAVGGPPRHPHVREAAGAVVMFLVGVGARPVLARTGRFGYLLAVLDRLFSPDANAKRLADQAESLRRENRRLRRRLYGRPVGSVPACRNGDPGRRPVEAAGSRRL